MSGLILATEQAVGSHLFRTASWAKPAALWVGLFLTAPNNAGSGGVEPAGGAYARVQRNPGDANWGMDGATFYNLADIIFPLPTADWGMVTHAGLWSASSGGTLYIVAPLISRTPYEGHGRDPFMGVYVRAGEPAVKFDAGFLRFTVS